MAALPLARQFGPCAAQSRSALALLAVMMREQDPLYLLYADLMQMVQHTAVAQVNQQRDVAIAQDIAVAGVAPYEEVREVFPIDCCKSRTHRDARRLSEEVRRREAD